MNLFFFKDITNLFREASNNLKEFLANFSTNCKTAIVKLKNLTDTNYQLGLDHLQRGNIFDAKLRFNIVLKLRPDFCLAHYHLARTYIYNLEFDIAKKELEQVLAMQPDFTNAEYRIKFIDKKR